MRLVVLGRIISLSRPFVRQAAKSLFQAVKSQDRIIDLTYRKAGIYNRDLRAGIKHELTLGAAIGSLISIAPDSPGNEFQTPIQPRKFPKTYKPYKTRGRQTRRGSLRSCRPDEFSQRSRRSYSR